MKYLITVLLFLALASALVSKISKQKDAQKDISCNSNNPDTKFDCWPSTRCFKIFCNETSGYCDSSPTGANGCSYPSLKRSDVLPSQSGLKKRGEKKNARNNLIKNGGFEYQIWEPSTGWNQQNFGTPFVSVPAGVPIYDSLVTPQPAEGNYQASLLGQYGFTFALLWQEFTVVFDKCDNELDISFKLAINNTANNYAVQSGDIEYPNSDWIYYGQQFFNAGLYYSRGSNDPYDTHRYLLQSLYTTKFEDDVKGFPYKKFSFKIKNSLKAGLFSNFVSLKLVFTAVATQAPFSVSIDDVFVSSSCHAERHHESQHQEHEEQ